MVTVGAEASRSELDDAASMTQTMQVYAIVPWLKDKGRSGKVAQNEWAAFLEDNIMLSNNKTIVTPGIRFDSSTNSKSNWSPSFNFSHQVSENWKIKGGVARSYKAPNLYQSSPNYLLINASNGCLIDSANNWNNPNALNSTGSVVKTDAKGKPYTVLQNSHPKGFDWGRACYFLSNPLTPVTANKKTVENAENFMHVIYNTGESLVTQYQLGSYGIWGANVCYKFNNSFSLRVGVNNILDKRIYRNAGTARTYNERGRSYFTNLKYSF